MYSRPGTRDQELATLLRERYGASHERRRPEPRRAVQLSVDSGEELLVRPVVPEEDDYVVDRPEPPADLARPAPPSLPVLPVEPPPTLEDPALLTPPAEAGPVPVPAAPPPAPSAPPGTSPAAPAATPPAAPPSLTQQPAPTPAPAGEGLRSGSGLTDADLAADMQAILGGGMVFDQSTGRVRPRADGDPAPGSAPADPASPAGGTTPQSTPATPAPERPLPDAPDEQSIFDRIARSMEHANSFDLGTHELNSRFSLFQQADEARRHRPAAAARPFAGPPTSPARTAPAPATPAPVAPLTPAPVAGLHAEDFAAAYEQDVPGRVAGCAGSGVTAAMVLAAGGAERSIPMYDTGEHVRSGGDLFPDRLVVGRAPGVPFSYGQIIAMADFYATVDDLLAADPAELSRLKALIVRNTAYYVGGKTDPAGDVGNEEWDRATGNRYLHLAEGNYDHFAPASLLDLPGTQTQPDHRQRWEEHHRRALREKAALVLAHPASTPFAMAPLTVNAFGDHFLTDAFAAGHLVNKELLMARFRSRFFSGSALTPVGEEFFEKVADRAWTPRVESAMSRLEPSSPPLCAYGWCLPVRPNIRTAGMFAEVLKQAAAAEPAKIANLAVKVLHDRLNRDGVDVVNDAGDSWRLTGDGHLTARTLEIMRRAVDQSVANLDDGSILASNANHDPLVARVWRYTPRPTPASRVTLTRAVDTYTDPGSADFVAATADLINDQIDVLVQALVGSNRMQEGGGI
jgi:hypothetical protein